MFKHGNNIYTYHGIPGTRFIWHGEWSDPEVEYQGKLYNGNSLEDTLWSIYKTECEENGKEPSEEEFDNLPIDWFTNNFLDITMEDINETKNMKKNVIKLNEAQLRKVVAESVKKVLIRESESDMFYPGKLLYNIKSEKLVGDMGYEFCDLGDLGSISPEIVKRGIIEHFQEDYPNEELYPIEDDGFPRQCEVLYVEDKNHNAIDNIVYISSQDAEYADAIKSKLGGNSVVKVVAPTLPESKTIKNMKKNVIKLNEAQLRKVVAESVQKVLSELDWKTYQNAANKANKRMDKRFNKFMSASDKAFNDKYGYNPDAAYKEPTVRKQDWNLVGVNDDDRELRRMYDYDSETDTYTNPRNYDATKALGILDKYDDEKRYKRYHNPSLKRFFDNPEQEKAYSKASKEMDDYRLGKYDYDSENGWHLKESKLNAIVAESIKKVLANLNK